MKALILIITFSIILGVSCKMDNKNNGIEIYRVDHSYLDLKKKVNPDCNYCFEHESVRLFDKPLLRESDFEKFDWAKQQIILTGIKPAIGYYS